MQAISYDSWSITDNALMITVPDLVVVHESLAAEVLSWCRLHKPDLPIAVVVQEHLTRTTRYWTSIGATQVWSLNNWTYELCQRDEDTNQRLQDGTETHLNLQLDQSDEAFTIAVAGVYGGVGVTHTALSIAHYLTLQGRVALWEAGSNPCFDFLEYSLNGEFQRKAKFDLNRKLTLFKKSAPLEMVEFVMGEYKFLIYDLGCMETEQQMNLFTQSDCPILIGSAALWRQTELVQFCRRYARMRQDRWRFVFPNCSEVNRDIRDCLSGRTAFAMPSNPDPTKISPDAVKAIEAILGIVQPKQSKKRFLFRS